MWISAISIENQSSSSNYNVMNSIPFSIIVIRWRWSSFHIRRNNIIMISIKLSHFSRGAKKLKKKEYYQFLGSKNRFSIHFHHSSHLLIESSYHSYSSRIKLWITLLLSILYIQINNVLDSLLVLLLNSTVTTMFTALGHVHVFFFHC